MSKKTSAFLALAMAAALGGGYMPRPKAPKAPKTPKRQFTDDEVTKLEELALDKSSPGRKKRKLYLKELQAKRD